MRVSIRELCVTVLIASMAAGVNANSNSSSKLDPVVGKPSDDGKFLFYDARLLCIEGQGWAEVDSPYDRLPTMAKSAVRKRIWDLAGDSTGLSVRFRTNAQSILARWTLRSPELGMNHMPATGVSGLDLYVRTESGGWHWLAVGVPMGETTTTTHIEGLLPGKRDYILYLPLYNGVKSLEVGIPKETVLEQSPPRASAAAKPVVFYGTSITQGGCASRPGMCYSAILGRRLDRPTINLGFSSNGTMDLEMARLIAEIDSAAIVVDCVPNMTPEMVVQRTQPFVKKIRENRPTVPILLVEDRTFADSFLVPAKQSQHAATRSALRKAYESLVGEGDRNLGYLSGDSMLAQDGEDTVDGSHVTDLGFVHISDAMTVPLQKLLKSRL